MKWELAMGRLVEVTATLERQYEGDKRWWEETPCAPWLGWIVGFRHLQNGVYHRACAAPSDWGNVEEFDPPYLEQTGTVQCALVAPSPSRNPVKVPKGGWRLL